MVYIFARKILYLGKLGHWLCGGKCWFFEYKITGLLKSPGISFLVYLCVSVGVGNTLFARMKSRAMARPPKELVSTQRT